MRIVAGGNLLRLQELTLARSHIVFVELRRRRHRRIGKADRFGIIFRAALQPERIGLFLEGDCVLVAALAVADDDARQPVFAFEPQDEVAVCVVRQDQPSWLVRDDLAPVLPAGRGDGRFHDLEVLGAVGIGQDEEDVAALRHVVFDAPVALRDQLRRRQRFARRDEPDLGRLVVVDIDEDEVVEPAAADAHEESGVGLFIDQAVVLGRRADAVIKELRRAVVGVEPRVEEAFALGVEHAAATRVGHEVIEIGEGLHVADLERVELRSLVVEAPQQPRVVG